MQLNANTNKRSFDAHRLYKLSIYLVIIVSVVFISLSIYFYNERKWFNDSYDRNWQSHLDQHQRAGDSCLAEMDRSLEEFKKKWPNMSIQDPSYESYEKQRLDIVYKKNDCLEKEWAKINPGSASYTLLRDTLDRLNTDIERTDKYFKLFLTLGVCIPVVFFGVVFGYKYIFPKA